MKGDGRSRGKVRARAHRVSMTTSKTRRDDVTASLRHGALEGERWTKERGREMGFRLALVGHDGYGYVIDNVETWWIDHFRGRKKGLRADWAAPGWARRCFKDPEIVANCAGTSIFRVRSDTFRSS